MKTSALIFTLGALLLSSGCVSLRECHRYGEQMKGVGYLEGLTKSTEIWYDALTKEQARCKADLDRVAAECADSTAEDAPATAPIFGRGGFGQ